MKKFNAYIDNELAVPSFGYIGEVLEIRIRQHIYIQCVLAYWYSIK